jgi:hypothetical protein
MSFLIKFIFITIIIFWIIRGLLRLIFPVIIKSVFSNLQNQAAKSQPHHHKPDGSISIDYMPKKEKKGNADKLGDFVDYEEVK